jgi:hypothetical protein
MIVVEGKNMPDAEKYVNLETIDQALLNSASELEKLALIYRQRGFQFEADEILETIKRISDHIGHPGFQH